MMISPLHQAAKVAPDAIAIKSPQGDISYRQLSVEVRGLVKALLSQGINSGDRLACIGNNSADLIRLYWACVDAKIIFFPISPRFPLGQIQGLFREFKVNHYWAEPSLALTLDANLIEITPHTAETPWDALPAPRLDQAVSLILTSGSSGKPKGALHSLGNHIASAKASCQLIPVALNHAWLLSLPLFHIGGLAILHRCAKGLASTVLVNPKLSLGEQIQQDNISHLSLVSAQLYDLLSEQPLALGSINALLLGGGPIDETLISQLKRLKIPSFISYGMTEMSSQITTTPLYSSEPAGLEERSLFPLDPPLKQLLTECELTLVDGTIWVRGPSLFLGYLDAQGLNPCRDENGWFCTQDKGRFDEKGRLIILGRADNLFISGGENIHPEEIENALRRHPDIIDALVFPVYDEKFGKVPAAIVRWRENSGSALSANEVNTGEVNADVVNDCEVNSSQLSEAIREEIKAFLSTVIASFKCPKRYYPWPNVTSDGLKVPRRQIIESIIESYNL
jgi:O-succinylbenzoic acid--CoA ligase